MIRSIAILFPFFLANSSLVAQSIVIEIKNEIQTTITAMDGQMEVSKVSVPPSGNFQSLSFPIEDLANLIQLRIEGESKFQIRAISLRLTSKTEVKIEGTEVRAILFLPNYHHTKYLPNGDVELSSGKTYTFTVRLPAETYFNYRTAFKDNWEKAVIITGYSQRYARLALAYDSFGEEKVIYAHYLPIRAAARSISPDSIVFYIPPSLTQNIRIKVDKADNCFKVRDVYLIDNSSWLKKLITEGEIKSSRAEIKINAKDKCLAELSDDYIAINIGGGISLIKYLIITLSAIVLYFANNFLFSKINHKKWDPLQVR